MRKPEPKCIREELDSWSYSGGGFCISELTRYKNSKYHDYAVELVSNNCGCWSYCSCDRLKLAVLGLRWETNEEFTTRVAKEKADEEDRDAKQQASELIQLAALQAKYKGKT